MPFAPGTAQIIATIDGSYQVAAICILVAHVFDGLDGRIARLTKSTSKFGIEYEKVEADVIKRNSGGQLVTIFGNDVHPTMPIYQHSYWTTPTATIDDAPISQLNASPAHKNTTLFVQDRWSILPQLTLNFGVRWDRQQIIDDFAKQQGVERRDISDQEIVERTLYTMVNEGAKILEEGMAQRASDIDVVWVYGYGWPVYRGGPMFWADTEGLAKIVEGLKRQEQRMGTDFSFSKLLLDKAEKGEKFTR